jgi:Predicted hydrolases or acyltransferases (alpha/beta hydrolase superfamily)
VTATAVGSGTVEASGLSLAYGEQGEGEPVVLVHGTALGRRVWEEVIAALGDGVRAIAYDRRAYGESEAPEPYRGTTVSEQSEDAAALIEALGAAPAIVCGHELGALVALDLVRRHPNLTRAAVLLEPPVLALSQAGPVTVRKLREAIERGAREAENSSAGAVDAYLETVAGPNYSDLVGAPGRLDVARSAGAGFGRRSRRSADVRLRPARVAGHRRADHGHGRRAQRPDPPRGGPEPGGAARPRDAA